MNVASEDRNLVAQHDDFDSQVRISATDEADQLKYAAVRPVEEREGHRSMLAAPCTSRQSCSSQPADDVLGTQKVLRERVGTGATVLLTTQYMEEAEQLADRIVVIDKGTVIADGTADQLKARTGGATLEARVTRGSRQPWTALLPASWVAGGHKPTVDSHLSLVDAVYGTHTTRSTSSSTPPASSASSSPLGSAASTGEGQLGPPGDRPSARRIGHGDGSSSATMAGVAEIAQKELRNYVGEVLRRAEAGEIITVTVAGRPVAELGPVHRRRWVRGAALAAIWRAEAPRGLEVDLERLPAGVVDPFAS